MAGDGMLILLMVDDAGDGAVMADSVLVWL